MSIEQNLLNSDILSNRSQPSKQGNYRKEEDYLDSVGKSY